MAICPPQSQKIVHVFINAAILGCFLLIRAPHAFASNFVNRIEQAEITTSDLAHYALGQIDDSLVTSRKTALEVPILDYHEVRPQKSLDTFKKRNYIISPKLFELQMHYLKQKGYTVILLQDLAAHLASSSPLSAKTVVLTFDDGFQSQFDYAFPILKKYDFHASFFIFTDAKDKTSGYMTWGEIAQLSKAGMDIGNHTASHAHLASIKRLDDLQNEINLSRQIILQHTGRAVLTFAYPFGEYNDNVLALVRKAGYSAAVSVRDGDLQTSADRFTLKRYNMNDNNRVFMKIFEENEKETSTAITSAKKNVVR